MGRVSESIDVMLRSNDWRGLNVLLAQSTASDLLVTSQGIMKRVSWRKKDQGWVYEVDSVDTCLGMLKSIDKRREKSCQEEAFESDIVSCEHWISDAEQMKLSDLYSYWNLEGTPSRLVIKSGLPPALIDCEFRDWDQLARLGENDAQVTQPDQNTMMEE